MKKPSSTFISIFLTFLAKQLSYNRSFLLWPLNQILIRYFIYKFKVDLSEALIETPLAYRCFNDFFTRKLKPHARPLVKKIGSLHAPCDGILIEHGALTQGKLIQAKGLDYSVNSLIHSEEHQFAYFYTFYLSPRHYHRAHAPLEAKILNLRYLSGLTRSVSMRHVSSIPNLYVENERLVLQFDGYGYGSYAIVMVGAQNVASISTPWYGVCSGHLTSKELFSIDPVFGVAAGEEIANFNMGSTIVLLLEKIPHQQLVSKNQEIKLHQTIAEFN
ncbi:MAG: archaetidylserine decarboxylase [Methylacidiphilales bacterium]|nr:archaetidylserine decarboxylase [Candidatus Methylacidiphilales bacterium]